MAVIFNVLAIVLTIMVLSRIIGNNVVFRIAQYLLVGVSLGLAFVVSYHQVLRPAVLNVASGTTPALLLYGVPLVLGVLLLPRITQQQRFSSLANIPLSIIFGVGAALAIGGAVVGTLLPQAVDTARPLRGDLFTTIGVVVLTLGTVATLSSFYYTIPTESRSGRIVAVTSRVGHWLLMVAFGFFFASAVQTYMSALIERLQFLVQLGGLL